jgi:hypothetical protein
VFYDNGDGQFLEHISWTTPNNIEKYNKDPEILYSLVHTQSYGRSACGSELQHCDLPIVTIFHLKTSMILN